MVSLLNPELYGESVPAFVWEYIQLLEDSVKEADAVMRGMPGAKGAFTGSLVNLERFVERVEGASEECGGVPDDAPGEGDTPFLQEEDIMDDMYPERDEF